MKRIDISKYKVEVPIAEGKTILKPYDVAGSIKNVLLANGPITKQKLGMADLLRNSKVAEKIIEQFDVKNKQSLAIIEDSDYAIIKDAFNNFMGFGFNEVELCKRIEEAEDIKPEDIKVKKRKK